MERYAVPRECGSPCKGCAVTGLHETAIACSARPRCRLICCVYHLNSPPACEHLDAVSASRWSDFSCLENVCLAFVFRQRASPTRLRGVAALHVRYRSVPAGPAAPHSRQRMQAACGGARLGRGSSHFLLTSCAGKKPIIRRALAALRWCWPCHAAGMLPCRGTDTLR